MKFVMKYQDEINQLCSNHHVDKLYVFGSASKDSMTPFSDVDLLVKFKPFELSNYFSNYMNFKLKLQSLFKRNVDLLEEQAISNPILINSIEKSKELIYG